MNLKPESVACRQEEVEAFTARNRLFIESLPTLETAIRLATATDSPLSDPADALVHFLGARCIEDFEEILLLCANGYSAGAASLLRGMFERAVTAEHIHAHPDEAADFIEYDWIRRHKLLQQVRLMPNPPSDLLEDTSELEAQYERVRERFMIAACDKCGTRRLNHSWSKIDLVTMAGRLPRFAGLVLPAYYLPLAHAHSTLSSATARVTKVGGTLSRTSEPDRAEADGSLETAHRLLLFVIATQLAHFGFQEGEEAFVSAIDDHDRVWSALFRSTG